MKTIPLSQPFPQREKGVLEIDDWKKQIEEFNKKIICEAKTSHFSTKNALHIINSKTEKNLKKYIFVTDV